jgi:hypothetical protein
MKATRENMAKLIVGWTKTGRLGDANLHKGYETPDEHVTTRENSETGDL